MSGSEDMIEILVGERDRALREVMALERELDEARAEVERLRRGIEAYRRLVSVHRVEAHGVNTHQTITNNNHASAVWQWEAEQ